MDTQANLREIVEKLDANAPDIKEIDWSIFDHILRNTDFTKCHDAMQSMKIFYNRLWVHVVFPLQDDLHLYQRENGRLILEADAATRKADKLEKEIETLRERLQEESPKEA